MSGSGEGSTTAKSASLPIMFDPGTGGLSVSGQPVILMPRHFLAFTQMEFENAIGIDETRHIIEAATYRAAKTWCRRAADANKLEGEDILRYYLDQVGKRGLGLYDIREINPTTGTATIYLRNSIYSAEYGPDTGRKTCYMSAASCRGGMEVVLESRGHSKSIRCEEIACASEGAPCCVFEVRPY